MSDPVFPLSLAEFFDAEIIREAAFDLGEAMTSSETGGGELVLSQRGVRLWGGSILMPTLKARRQAPQRALLNALRAPGATFLIADIAMRFPAADPQGMILGGVSPMVAARGSTWTQMSIGGLPAGYQISAGDHLSVIFGGAAARRAYFEVVRGASVVAGVAGPISVVPPIPDGVQVGNAVQLLSPALKAKVVPKSYGGARRVPGRMATGLTFEWRQTLE